VVGKYRVEDIVTAIVQVLLVVMLVVLDIHVLVVFIDVLVVGVVGRKKNITAVIRVNLL